MNSFASKPVSTVAVTWVLFVPLLFFVARGTLSFDPNNGFGVSSLVGNPSSPMYRVEQGLIYGLIGVIILQLLRSILVTVRRSWPVLLLPSLAIVSAVWSTDPFKSFAYGVFALLLTLFGVYLVERFPAEQRFDLFLIVGWFAIVGSYLLAMFVPTLGIEAADQGTAWRGIFIHKNHLGIIMVYVMLFALYAKGHGPLHRAMLALFAVSSVVLIGLSQSRTSWLLLVATVAFAVVLRVTERWRQLEKLMLIIALIVTVGVLSYIALNYFPIIATHLGKESTLTGRTGIWAAIIPEIMKRPFFGFGYYAFWTGISGEAGQIMLTPGNREVANSENPILQIGLELGLAGLVCLGITLLCAIRNAVICVRGRSTPYIRWCVTIVFITLLALVDGEKIMFPHTIEWILFVIAYIGLSKQARRISGERRELKAAP